MALPVEYDHDSDLQYHYRTYRNFVRWVLLVALHALVILALLEWFLG